MKQALSHVDSAIQEVEGALRTQRVAPALELEVRSALWRLRGVKQTLRKTAK